MSLHNENRQSGSTLADRATENTNIIPPDENVKKRTGIEEAFRKLKGKLCFLNDKKIENNLKAKIKTFFGTVFNKLGGKKISNGFRKLIRCPPSEQESLNNPTHKHDQQGNRLSDKICTGNNNLILPITSDTTTNISTFGISDIIFPSDTRYPTSTEHNQHNILIDPRILDNKLNLDANYLTSTEKVRKNQHLRKNENLSYQQHRDRYKYLREPRACLPNPVYFSGEHTTKSKEDNSIYSHFLPKPISVENSSVQPPTPATGTEFIRVLSDRETVAERHYHEDDRNNLGPEYRRLRCLVLGWGLTATTSSRSDILRVARVRKLNNLSHMVA